MGEFVIFYDTTRVVEAPLKKAVLYQKCAYQMKVNFLPAVIGEIDDDDNSEWTMQGRCEHSRLQIALLCELSLYHFTPET